MSLDHDEVAAAAELVIEELRRAIDDVKEQAAAALDTNRFEDAQRLAGAAEQVTGLVDRARAMVIDWQGLGIGRQVGVADAPGDEPVSPTHRRDLGRLPKGTRTPEPAFRLRILRALVDAGGSSPIADVLDRVGEQMAAMLNDADRQTLPSDADAVRWRNTAQWSRVELVKLGLMAPSHERGVWEIADAGRTYLAEHNEEGD